VFFFLDFALGVAHLESANEVVNCGVWIWQFPKWESFGTVKLRYKIQLSVRNHHCVFWGSNISILWAKFYYLGLQQTVHMVNTTILWDKEFLFHQFYLTPFSLQLDAISSDSFLKKSSGKMWNWGSTHDVKLT